MGADYIIGIVKTAGPAQITSAYKSLKHRDLSDKKQSSAGPDEVSRRCLEAEPGNGQAVLREEDRGVWRDVDFVRRFCLQRPSLRAQCRSRS
jgi:hypothetical protein